MTILSRHRPSVAVKTDRLRIRTRHARLFAVALLALRTVHLRTRARRARLLAVALIVLTFAAVADRTSAPVGHRASHVLA